MFRKLLLGAIPTLVAGIAVMTITAQERSGVSLALVKLTLVKVSKPGSQPSRKVASPKFHSAHSNQQPQSQSNLSGDHSTDANWGGRGYRGCGGYYGYRGYRGYYGYRGYHGYHGYYGYGHYYATDEGNDE